MELQAAEKSIRQGAIAGLVVTGLTALVVTAAVTTGGDGPLAFWNDPFNFVDVGLLAVLTAGLWMRSRTAAVLMLLYFVLSKILIFVETGQPSQLVMSVLFVYFFGKAALGAFAYHRIRRAQDPDYRPAGKAAYLLLIPGVLIGAAVAGLLVIGIIGPSTAVLTGDEVGRSDLALLRTEGIVDVDERIVMFYSAGLFSVREEGNVITERRVISYEEFEGKVQFWEAAFGEINDVSVAVTGDFMTDTAILVSLSSGETFYLFASTENGGDERFLAELRKRIM